jgi:hypothetical protein
MSDAQIVGDFTMQAAHTAVQVVYNYPLFFLGILPGILIGALIPTVTNWVRKQYNDAVIASHKSLAAEVAAILGQKPPAPPAA